jgi:hypothetical protein
MQGSNVPEGEPEVDLPQLWAGVDRRYLLEGKMSDFESIAKATGIDITVVTEEDLSMLVTMTAVRRTKSIVGIYSMLAMVAALIAVAVAIPVVVALWVWAIP